MEEDRYKSERTENCLTNYHTHTWRCQHAGGTEEEYVQRAIRNGFSVFGFADHSPWPYKSDYVCFMRMRLDQFAEYERVVRSLAKKYAGQIEIPLGLECEAFPDYFGWLKDFKAEHLDYVILGNHYDYCDEGNAGNAIRLEEGNGFYFGHCTRPEEVRRYGKRTVAGMETGLYDYVAHPDLFCFNYAVFDAECEAVSRDLCAAAEAYHLPLEYNLMGVQHAEAGVGNGLGYPCRRFWEIASDYHIRAIVGLDGHQLRHIDRSTELYDRAYALLGELKIPVIRELKEDH